MKKNIFKQFLNIYRIMNIVDHILLVQLENLILPKINLQ